MDLTISTHQYLKYVLPTLVLESDSNLLFPRLSGDAHDHQSFRSNWLRIQAEYQAPWQPFPPQCTRLEGRHQGHVAWKCHFGSGVMHD